MDIKGFKFNDGRTSRIYTDTTLTEEISPANSKAVSDLVADELWVVEQNENALRSNIAVETTNRQSEIEVERARINAIASLPSGSTAADAEIIDARIGADGTTYDSLGDAIRGQILGADINAARLSNISGALLNALAHVAWADPNGKAYYRALKSAIAATRYTNLIPSAIDSNNNVYNNIGYKNGYYMSGVSEHADANCTITGCIPLRSVGSDGIGDKYRIMGVGEPSSSHTRIAFITSAFESKTGADAFLSGSVTIGPMGAFDLSTETVDGETVYVLTQKIKISSSYSNVEYLKFSFDGTDGADLVITCNEAIT